MTTVSGKEFQILIIRTEKKLDLMLWRGVDTGLSLMELPLVPYGDKLMWKKADASRSTRFFTILKHIRRSENTLRYSNE